MSQARRITYTSTAADPEFRAHFDRALAEVRERAPIVLGGNVGEGPVEGRPEHRVVSPIDTRRVVAEVATATPGEVESARRDAFHGPIGPRDVRDAHSAFRMTTCLARACGPPRASRA